MNNRSIYIYLSITLLSIVTHVESVSAQREYSVEECVEMAISNNEKIIRGEIDIEASQQRVREAYTHYFPSVEATASGFKANSGLIDTSVDLEGVIPAEVAAMLPAD
ncbi:MAG: TolC family protein, partial [Rikenellaceae bacterium]